ncbi:MAG: OadG family protein [Clostridia bacterium]|nr:OadG family protein [Clostridia bacterium]
MEYLLSSILDGKAEVGQDYLDAFVIAILGFAIVFCVLVVLMFIIKIMGVAGDKAPSVIAKMPKISFKKKKGEEVVETETAEVSDAPKAEGTCGDLLLVNTEEKDAAMIMAIVADRTGTPLNELRFKSIKRIDNDKESEK